jgi:hypothetical protein
MMTTAVESGAMGGDDHLERTIIDTHAQMSYLGSFGHVVPGGEKCDTAAEQGR